MASTYLTKYNSSTASTNQYKGTFSFWVKKSSGNYLFSQGDNTSGGSAIERLLFYMNSSGDLGGGFRGSGGSPDIDMSVSGKYRDCNGWYHVIYAYDTSLLTASERVRVYVNNIEQTVTWTGNASAVPQNTVFPLNKTSYSVPLYIGSSFSDGSFFDGIMSYVNYVDGQQLTPSSFGEYDANGVWKIKTSPSVTYGTNGFFILKDGNSVTDQSGNGNNFTVGGGTLTKTEDCPSNVFATLNPLDGYVSHMVFSHGNNTVDNGSTASNKSYARSTLGMSSGKFYFEAKNITNANYQSIGITDKASGGVSGELGGSSADYVYRNDAGQKGNNNSFSSYGNSYTTNDIIGCAVDLDNLKIYFSKNGVWQNSGDPTSGATGTGAAFTITAPSLTSTGFYFFGVGDSTAANSSKWSANFGNGYFGSTQISSAGTNASGIGIFEFDCPAGFTALSTKGLNL